MLGGGWLGEALPRKRLKALLIWIRIAPAFVLVQLMALGSRSSWMWPLDLANAGVFTMFTNGV